MILEYISEKILLFLSQNIYSGAHNLLCVCVSKSHYPKQYFCSSNEVSSDEVSSKACDNWSTENLFFVSLAYYANKLSFPSWEYLLVRVIYQELLLDTLSI
jgi:hypothetical protein